MELYERLSGDQKWRNPAHIYNTEPKWAESPQNQRLRPTKQIIQPNRISIGLTCFSDTLLEEGLEDAACAIRQEARHRLKKGRGVRVFGNPGLLDDWFRKNKIDPKDRAHLITHAGECVDSFITKDNGQAEIFVHAPFSFDMDGKTVDQNGASLVLHGSFFEGASCSRVMLAADNPYNVWDGIVHKTKAKGRKERLIWDVFSISHHCSYKALSPDKGKEKTEPIESIKYLFEQGEQGCCIISSSEVIPSKDTDQPPHRQAAVYYREVANDKDGDFLVTMERPSKEKPKKIVIEIGSSGIIWRKVTGVATGCGAVIAARSQRQGHQDAI